MRKVNRVISALVQNKTRVSEHTHKESFCCCCWSWRAIIYARDTNWKGEELPSLGFFLKDLTPIFNQINQILTEDHGIIWTTGAIKYQLSTFRLQASRHDSRTLVESRNVSIASYSQWPLFNARFGMFFTLLALRLLNN